MKIASVSKEGEFSMEGDPRQLFTTMMVVRLHIVCEVQYPTFLSLRTCLRYASCRRQFKTYADSQLERKIIDYQTFQAQITPHVAYTYAHSVVATYIKQEYH